MNNLFWLEISNLQNLPPRAVQLPFVGERFEKMVGFGSSNAALAIDDWLCLDFAWFFQETRKTVTISCDENRGKIDDFITIREPINCALYRDKIDQFVDFCGFFCWLL